MHGIESTEGNEDGQKEEDIRSCYCLFVGYLKTLSQ
jgi:hypothetical protein